ncbi:uncharacterized protein LOC135207538 isoform X2 [Macrobrachium nipponense]|uniref:uncharacterized protein LOC135207538 isoform X2 n=1 Tax=Macrobrachium nipponense TaxID=159736 RepID=UPI0030C84428
MVGAYTTLPPAVAATVPRRTVLRDSWIRHQPPDSPEPSSAAASAAPSTTASLPSSSPPPPMTPRTPPKPLKLGELRQRWDTPRPTSVVLTTYSPPNTSEELQGISGRVSKAKAFFESGPLQEREEIKTKPPLQLPFQQDETPTDTIVSYRVKNPLRISPTPKPRRLRNTISTFPKWVSEDDSKTKDHDVAVAEEDVVTAAVSSSSPPTTAAASAEADSSGIEITCVKPSYYRRRYGTVTGLIIDRTDIEDVLRKRLAEDRNLYGEGAASVAVRSGHSYGPVDDDDDFDGGGQDDEVGDGDANFVCGGGGEEGGGGGSGGVSGDDYSLSDADSQTATVIAAVDFDCGTGTSSSNSNSNSRNSSSSDDDEIHTARRVAVVVSAGESSTSQEQEEQEEEEQHRQDSVSWGRDAAWNRHTCTSPSQGPFPSCRRRWDYTQTSYANTSTFSCGWGVVSSSSSSAAAVAAEEEAEGTHSECQGSSASEGHASPSSAASSKAMIVLPQEDAAGKVQAAAAATATAAPRVVAACIKSYHDIPEELFNSLQESSVDPQSPSSSSPSPPPPPPPSSPPPSGKNASSSSSTSLVPTPAPRGSEWKTMQEARKALLMGEVSDADTEEEEEVGSEVELGGVASTSDYHTSEGRGSSLSGASDDHHRHDGGHDSHQPNQAKNDHVYYYNNNNSYHTDSKDVDIEDPEYECYNHEASPPTVLIRNNFRGFCSTMLGTSHAPLPLPVSHDYINSPVTSPRGDHHQHHRPSSAEASLLEEELRAAGIYFRRPGSPPRIPSRCRTLSPPPPRPPPSSSALLKRERGSVGEAEAVAAALHVLDASLAGLSGGEDSSGESSPARSHASTVVERRHQQQQLQCSPDSPPADTLASPCSISSSAAAPHGNSFGGAFVREGGDSFYGPSEPPSSGNDRVDAPENSNAGRSPPSVRVYISGDLNDSAVDYNYESGLSSTCSAEDSSSHSHSGRDPEGRLHHHEKGPEDPDLEDTRRRSRLGNSDGIIRGSYGRDSASSSTVGGTGEEDGGGEGPFEGPLHHHLPHPKETFNLIEEVYVDTRPAVPRSTVSMRAYYPGVNYDSSSSSSPKSSLKPPSSSSSRHPERGTSLDSTQTVPADSDSGHESGATSPCGTLILDDTQSPPPSPPNNHHTLKTHHPAAIHTHASSSLSHSRTSSLHSCRGPGVLEGEVGVAVVGDPTHTDMGVGGMALEPRPPTHFVVVAIDFGTTYSGYAFSFTRDPDSIHMMKKWEGGDPGVQNQKTPTIVLLTPDEEFHSLGFIARDTYHDLDPKEAKKWLYFDKFKMALHADENLSRDTLLEAANGRKIPALKIFSYALKYFRDHALKELSDQAGVEVLEEDVRWVITVPAIWSHPAKQFMRTAAYQAGMGSSARPEQLLIALEPEAAAIYCRRLRRHQLLPERPPELRPPRYSVIKDSTPPSESNSVPALPELDRDTVYAVVDCGGGTVDITVHQMTDKATGHLKELHKATGGPHGSKGVDDEFERLLEAIFGADFMQTFRQQRPAAYVDLMIAFESRKRNASPYRSNPLNIALPFSFIDLFRRFRGKDVEWAMKKHQNLGVKWSAQGMLRVEQDTMRQLFMPTLTSITQAIEAVLSAPEVNHLQYMFLVGGFAESELLQKHIRDTFGHRVNVIIPQGMGLAILRGAVQFGLDPGVVTVRRSRLTYGVGVLNRYQRGVHPPDKRVVAAGSEWCADVLDRFVAVDESVAVGDVVVRPYTPATPGQSTVILHLYATHRHDAKFVTEDGVQRVGTLHLELGTPQDDNELRSGRREITVHMKFGDTEVKASAIDHLTGQVVRANIDFLAL